MLQGHQRTIIIDACTTSTCKNVLDAEKIRALETIHKHFRSDEKPDVLILQVGGPETKVHKHDEEEG
jgi:hypothetical protein